MYSCFKARVELIKLMFFITILASLSILLTYFLVKIDSTDSPKHQKELERLDILDRYVDSCKPLLNNKSQYYALIDGVRYPKRVPSFFNASINFDCVNSKSSNVKIILIWNWDDFRLI